MSRRSRSALALALGVGAVALPAADAGAATQVTYGADPFFTSMQIADATNDADAINVSVAGNTITISDTGTGGVTTADPDCAVVNATTVTCPLDPPDPAPPAPVTVPLTTINLSLNAGTDSFTNQNLEVQVNENDGS